MGHLFLGCNKGVASFIGSQPTRKGLGIVNYILLIGVVTLATTFFVQLDNKWRTRTFNRNFSLSLALGMACLIIIIVVLIMVYELLKLCKRQKEEYFTLTIQGNWTKISTGKWMSVPGHEVTPGMVTSDHYIHDSGRFSTGLSGMIRMVAHELSGPHLKRLEYTTSVKSNNDGVGVYGS